MDSFLYAGRAESGVWGGGNDAQSTIYAHSIKSAQFLFVYKYYSIGQLAERFIMPNV